LDSAEDRASTPPELTGARRRPRSGYADRPAARKTQLACKPLVPH